MFVDDDFLSKQSSELINLQRQLCFVQFEIKIMKLIVEKIGYHDLFVNPLCYCMDVQPCCLVLEYCDGPNLKQWLGSVKMCLQSSEVKPCKNNFFSKKNPY